MAKVVVRNIESDVKPRLKLHATQHRWSMKQEVRWICAKWLQNRSNRASSSAREWQPGLPAQACRANRRRFKARPLSR